MTELTLIQKFNETKSRLATAKLSKSGKNKFQNYEYFELGDFLPTIIQAEKELGFANIISFPTVDDVVTATLTIRDATSDAGLIFVSPIADASTKGASPIQAIGSMHTYMRRYLYVMAYEIAEHDSIDGLDQKQAKSDAAFDKKALLKKITDTVGTDVSLAGMVKQCTAAHGVETIKDLSAEDLNALYMLLTGGEG